MADDITSDLDFIKKFNQLGDNSSVPVNLSRERDNDFTNSNQLLLDRSSLTPTDFLKKYGPTVTRELDRLDLGIPELARMEGDDRTGAEVGPDALMNITGGLNNALGGVAVFGASMVSPYLGNEAADLLEGYNRWNFSKLSPEMQDAATLDALRTELDKQDSRNKFEVERKTDGDFVAGLKQYGRDTLSGIVRLGEDPRMVERLTEQGVGSVLAAGPVARGLSAIGTAMTKAAVGTAQVVPAAVAMMEGGSAYAAAANRVRDTSFEELEKTSPEYNQLITEGFSPEEARNKLAGQAGIIAESIQAPIGAVTGALVSKFEANPLGISSARTLVENTVRETVEEGIQSATGALAENLAVKATADTTQDPLEDVAGQTIQGAVSGSLSTIATQTPGTLIRETAEVIQRTAKGVTGLILSNGDRLISETEAKSPVSNENLAAASDAAVVQAPVIAEALQTLAQEAGTVNPEIETYIQNAVNAAKVTPEELEALPENIKNNIDPTGSKFNILQELAKVASNEDATKQDRISAALFIMDQFRNNRKLFSEDLPEFLNNVDQNREEYKQFSEYATILGSLGQSSSIREALTWANEAANSNEIVTTENINTSAGKQIVDNAIGTATHIPQQSNIAVNESILNMADTGNVELSPAQRQMLVAATSLLRSAQIHDNTLGITPEEGKPSSYISESAETVSQQIEKDGGAQRYQYSMEQHVRRINEAISDGNKPLARQRIADLAFFARHMRNKVNALIQGINAGDGARVPYQTLGSNHQWIPDKNNWNDVYFRPGNKNSINLAKRIQAEALAVANLANDIAKAYPEYNLKQIEIPNLPEGYDTPKASVSQERDETEIFESDSNFTPEPTVVAEKSESTTLVDASSAPVEEVDETAGTEEATSETKSASQTVTEGSDVNLLEASQEAATDTGVPSEPVVATSETKPSREPLEAPVEVVAVKPKVEALPKEEPQTFNLQKTYLGLLGKTNRFIQAFNFPKNIRSRLVILANPLIDVLELLSKPTELVEFMGHDVTYKVTSDNLEAWEDLVKIGGAINNFLTERLTNLAGPLIDEIIAGKEEILSYRDKRILNIVDTETKQYNDNLMQGAILAALDWIVNGSEIVQKLDFEDVSKIIKRAPTTAEIDAFNKGLSVEYAVRSLSSSINKYWGVSINKNAPEAYTKGISEAVAKEILRGLEKFGFIKISLVRINGKDYGRVDLDKTNKDNQDIINNLNGSKELLSDIALKDKARPIHIGKPPSNIAKTQLRNPSVKNTRQQLRAIDKQQNIPHYINEDMYDFISAIGEKSFVLMMGGMYPEKDKLNINHETSIDGVNRTLITSFQNVLSHVAEVASHAVQLGKSLSEIPTYYEYNITRVGRLQNLGLNNPQADKLAREIFMPTRSVLNLTNPVSGQSKQFWMTVGQGIGLKTAKLPRDKIVAQAQQRTLEGAFKPVVDKIETWLSDKKKGISSDIYQDIIAANGGAIPTMHMVHALVSVAKYNIALKNNNLKNFVHYNYLEADGKTNGPINALALLTSGKFTPEWLALIAKGGYFIGHLNKSLNDYIAQGNEATEDLYEYVAGLTSKYKTAFEQSISGNDPVKKQHDAFYRVLSILSPNIQFDGNELIIDRASTKNPLTIKIYGSGTNGISAKATNELLDIIYETLSSVSINGGKFIDYLNTPKFTNEDGSPYTNNDFLADLNLITSKIPAFQTIGKNNQWIIKDQPVKNDRENTDGDNSSPRTFKFSTREFNAFNTNVRVFFINHMVDAINEGVLDTVEETTKTVQKATQVQSIILTALYRNELIARLAEKERTKDKTGYKKGDFLSPAELEQIITDLMPYAPIIETGTQAYFLSANETTEVAPRTELADGTVVNVPEAYSTDLDGELRTRVYTVAPTPIGVGGVPTLVIGSGDGQMILNAVADLDAQGLPVYDGFNINALDIDVTSELMNKAVHQTWEDNPVRHVTNSFSEFLKNNPLQSLLDKNNPNNTQYQFLIFELSKIVSGTSKPSELINNEDANELLNQIMSDLIRISDEIDLRKEVLTKVNTSIDQMASAESPFSRKGIVSVDNTSFENIADALNKELDNVIINKKSESAIAVPTPEFEAALEKVTSQDGDVRVASVSDLKNLIDLVKIPAIHKEMLVNTLKYLTNSRYQIVFGTPQDIKYYQIDNYPTTYDPSSIDSYGKVDLVNRIIYVTNFTSETLVHELIHAATMDKTRAYYDKSTSLSSADQEALARIEGLMGEWIVQNYDHIDNENQIARNMALSTINGYLNQNKPAEALNEFMAWSLANQKIAEEQSKTKVKNNLFKVIGDVLLALRKLIWGTKFSPNPGDTLFSNLRFNARVLLATPSRSEVLMQGMANTTLYQSPAFGSNDRITQLRLAFEKKIAEFIKNGDAIFESAREQSTILAYIESNKTNNSFTAHGFSMSMQEQSTFEAIQTALAIDTRLNTNSLSRIQDFYSHVIQKLKVEDFMNDPDLNDPNDRYQAQQKFDVLNGLYFTTKDAKNRTNLLSSFLALAMVDHGFRTILSKMDVPEPLRETDQTLDAHLTNLGMGLMDNLSNLMAAEGKNPTTLAALDALTNSLLTNTADQQSFIEQTIQTATETLDSGLANKINQLSETVAQASTINSTDGPIVKNGKRFTKFIANIVNEKRASEVVKGVTTLLNQGDGFNTIRELIAEVVGRTEANAPIFDMIGRVRSVIQQTRQQFREHLPEELASKYTRSLKETEWSLLFKGLAKTDLSVMFDHFDLNDTLKVLTDSAFRRRLISQLEQQLETTDPNRHAKIKIKAKELAQYLNNGTTSKNFLRNATAVAHLFNEPEAVGLGIANSLVPIVDQLVTAYAIDLLAQQEISTLTDLINEQTDGIKFTLSYLIGERKDELAKARNSLAVINGYKGYIPSENQVGTSMVVADDRDFNDLVLMGYTRIGDYQGSSADFLTGRRGYYFSPVSGKATYNQGVLQTVHQTASGIDPQTGFTVDLTAGRIIDPQVVTDVKRRIRNSRNTTENLLPIIDSSGQVIAYERAIDPVRLTHLNRNTNLSQMMGAWRGRQIEEKLASQFNHALIDNLKAVWIKAQSNGEQNQFISFNKSNDPVHRDTWKLIPDDIKQYIRSVFGDDFMIRRDMINDAVGYRSASIGDLWTGNARLNPEVSKTIKRAAIGIFGTKAFGNLVGSEKFIQNLVSDARILIVIKSVIVPASNLVSNVFQLLNRGVPARTIIRGLGSKTAEVNDFIKRRDRQLKLDADLRSAKVVSNATQIRKIENELKSIKDSYKRMSIYPLIEAGEFNSISDGGITQEDLALAEGRWSQFIEKIADKIPAGMKTPVRYALITQDTALFKGLSRAIQYGDFLGKAIMYDDLTDRKKMSSKDALARISEEFVNYNRLAGRTRSYLESIGLIWFWNFKLRSMKTAVSMMRENPLRSLLQATLGVHDLPLIGSIGSPMADNFASVLADGRLGYSMGPGMGLNSPFLNPWLNIIK